MQSNDESMLRNVVLRFGSMCMHDDEGKISHNGVGFSLDQVECKIHPCGLKSSCVGYIKRSFSQTFFLHFHLRLKMSSSSESHASFSNCDHLMCTSSDEKILQDMDEEDMVIFYYKMVACNSHNSFTLHEIESMGQFVNSRVGV